MSLAPVAYFAFNRPEHTAATLAALAVNPEAPATDVHIFIDGPRNEREQSLVAEVAKVARSATGFRTIAITQADRNLGLFLSITAGVSRVVSEAGRVIVLEDDILVGRHFLQYMNEALSRYADQSIVGSIHAYSPPVAGLPEYFFLPGADCWGWATWSDRWALFRPDPSELLRSIVRSGRLREFALSHGWQSVLQLVARAQGRNQSWAIQWHASLFLARLLTLHPGSSFVRNIGNDGSGTHSIPTARHDVTERSSPCGDLPASIFNDQAAGNLLSSFLDQSALRNIPGPTAMFRLLLRCSAMTRAYLFQAFSTGKGTR